MYQTILLAAPLQQWDRYSAYALAARDVAASLVRHTSRRVHVLSVYEHPSVPNTVSNEMGAKYCERELQERADRAREEKVREADELMRRMMSDYVGPLEAEGFTISQILRVGHPPDVIVEIARSIGADMLIIGSHRKRGPFDVLGGTAQQIIRHAPCLVLLVSPKPGRHVGT